MPPAAGRRAFRIRFPLSLSLSLSYKGPDLIAIASCLLGCGEPRKHTRQWFAMDTDWSVVAYDAPGASIPADSAFALLERESNRLELVFSDFLPFSALHALGT